MAFAVLAVAAPGGAQAASLISNGGFESGFSGWTVADQSGSSGSWYIQSGTGSPLNSFAVPAPPEGTSAAMTDQTGPGSHVLYQDFVVPGSVLAATLEFSLFLSNSASDYFAPDSLDAFAEANQQFRADIITTTADPFSVAAGDVLQNLYQTLPGDPLVSGYTLISVDVTALLQAHLGETLRLRFAEVDNQLFFNAGVDAVSLNVVPEPSTLALAGVAAVVGLLAARRKVRATT